MFSYFRNVAHLLRTPYSLIRNMEVFRPVVPSRLTYTPNNLWVVSVTKRNSSSSKTMVVRPSEFLNKKTFDSLHFFVLLGAVPCLLIVFFVNVFVGPAELADIPEDYEPRYWEYHRHPISRFIAKHVVQHPQMMYESALGQLADRKDQAELVEEERWFRKSQRTHGDYRGWYFIPSNPAGVIRGRKEQELDQEIGEFVSR